MNPLQYELDRAEKLVIARYKEYQDSILGFGYHGATERLKKAIEGYELLKDYEAERDKSRLN